MLLYIKFSDSDNAIIFDTGIGGPPLRLRQKMYQYNNILVNELKAVGFTTIDANLLSHFHSNLLNILKNFTVKRIIPNISYDKWETQFGKDLEELKIPMADDIKNNYLVAGIVFEDWSYGAKNWMKHLTERKNAKENNKSNMIFFQYYGKKFLISGDAEKQLGNQIIKTNYIRPVDFYQVAHHVSDNALDANFIAKIKPKYCYIPGTVAPNKSDPWY